MSRVGKGIFNNRENVMERDFDVAKACLCLLVIFVLKFCTYNIAANA